MLFFALVLNTALRISDILKLKVSNIETGYVHTTETKTGKSKQFPINDGLQGMRILILNPKQKKQEESCLI